MNIPDLVQGEVGRTVPLVWDDNVDISSYTLTGKIETQAGPNFVSRVIAGLLTPTGSSGFGWTLAEEDTAGYGSYNVQFIATYGSAILRTIPQLIKIHRSLGWV